MPRMSSPDGSEVLSVPDAGVDALKSLGWTVEGTRKQQADKTSSAESAGAQDQPDGGAAKPEGGERRRGPGRPRKNPES